MKPPEKQLPELEAFHRHLDSCPRCAQQPFDLCYAGAVLLHRAGLAVAKLERDYPNGIREYPSGIPGRTPPKRDDRS